MSGPPYCMAPAHFLVLADLAFGLAFAFGPLADEADGAFVPSVLTPCCCRGGFVVLAAVGMFWRLLAQKNWGFVLYPKRPPIRDLTRYKLVANIASLFLLYIGIN